MNGGLADKFSCLVISLMDEGTIGSQIKELEVPVTIMNMPHGRPTFKGITKLRKVVRKFQPDIIQGWMYHGNLAASLSCALTPGCPALAWNIRHSLYDLEHEKPMTRQVIRANRFFSSAADVLLYNSHLSRPQHEGFGFASVNGQVIPNGIEV